MCEKKCDEKCECGWSNLKFDINSKFVALDDQNQVSDVYSLDEILVKYRLFPIVDDLILDEDEVEEVPEVV